jgi:hypothetical protein
MSGTNAMRVTRTSGSEPINEIIPAEVRTRAVPWLTRSAPFPVDDADRVIGARGWPCLALWCEYQTRVCSTFTTSPSWASRRPKPDLLGAPVGGIALPWPHVSPNWNSEPPPPLTSLPFRPLWGGLLVDTACFGVLWWGAIIGPAALRRWARGRRGLCRKCGYDLRGTPAGSPCPECGGAGGPA